MSKNTQYRAELRTRRIHEKVVASGGCLDVLVGMSTIRCLALHPALDIPGDPHRGWYKVEIPVVEYGFAVRPDHPSCGYRVENDHARGIIVAWVLPQFYSIPA